MSYRLGVDLGTTFTAAASVTGQEPPTMIGLGNRSLQVPSVLFIEADGSVLVGERAERRGLADPARLAREFKRRLGDPVPILVAGASYSAEALTARLLRWVVDHAASQLGGPAEAVVITHPANWGPYKLGLLDQAAAMAGIENVMRCTEPEAAAIQYAAHADVAVGDRLAVYDLGGGTFDVCMLRKADRGFEVLGSPDGLEHLGGVDFDEAIFQHVVASLTTTADLDPANPALSSALARLRRECVEAKEALSSDTDVTVPVAVPGLTTTVRLTRVEFEEMIRPSLLDSVAAIRRAMRSASVDLDDLSTIILVGGSSRIPLVSELLQSTLGVRTATDLHPKHDVALGAARAAVAAGTTQQTEPDSEMKPVASRFPITRKRRPPGAAQERPSSSANLVVGGPADAANTREDRVDLGDEPLEASEVDESSPRPKEWDRRRIGLAAAAVVVVIALVVFGVRAALQDRDPGATGVPPANSASSTGTPTPGPSVAPQSFDGGSYKWASGVRLTMSIHLVEQWGVRYPYCPDESCGFAKPKDLRVVLGYKIRAPKSLATSFDPIACPGKLTTLGAPARIRAVPNAYRKPIKSTIKPDTSESGRVEYSIPFGSRADTFEINTRCGDLGAGEVATFRGKFPVPRPAEVPFEAGDKPKNQRDFKMRVAEVRSDLGGRKYAVLVERCVRRTLPTTGAKASPLSAWTLITDSGTAVANDRWKDLLPRYPYGSSRKGACTSGWIAFNLSPSAKVESLVHQDPLLGDLASWKLGKGRTVQNSSSPPPATPGRSARPDPGASKSQPPDDPGPSTPSPSRSVRPTPRPSPS